MVTALATGSCLNLSDAADLPADMRGGVVAIGNFDGVHRGHRAVLETALEEARAKNVPAIALTFEPHPRTFFRPSHPVFRLTPSPLRARLLGSLGFDAVVEQPFDADFAGRSAASFVTDMLAGDLGVTHVVTGEDFHFGHNREGTPQFLKDASRKAGFDVTLIAPFTDDSGVTISSTRIRKLLGHGDVTGAAELLGYRHLVEAPVSDGRKLGRTLGYPTANMALPPEYGLAHGIYAVRLRRADGSIHDGVASFGRRPTVEEDGKALLETFVFDFNDDLYGEACAVSIFTFLRGEEKFDSLDALKAQMDRDAAAARDILKAAMPLSALDAELSFRPQTT